MNKLNLLLIWLAKGTLCQQSRPAFAQGFNTIFNTMMSFGGRITSSLTTTSAAFLRTHRQTRFCAILLAGLLGLVLAGCAGNSKDSAAPGGNRLLVTDVQSIVGDTNILLGWTNPDQDNITGFQITPSPVIDRVVDNETVPRSFTSIADGPGFSINKSARVTYDIAGLARNTTYEVVIGVIYHGDTDNPQNLRLQRMTTGDITTGIGNDFDLDSVVDREDNCDLVANKDQNNTDNAADGGDACDPDDDNDGVLDDADAFPLDACASVDADNDGRPDMLRENCETTLTVDDNVISSEPGGDNPLVVTDIQSIVGDTNILVGWTNPARDNITGFQITPHVVVDGSVDNASLAAPRPFTSGPGFSAAQDARVTYNITDLEEDTEYEVVIGVIYNGDTSDPQDLRLARMTTGDLNTGIGNDFDRDGFVDVEDNCHLVANPDQTNTDDADDGGDACDPDDDNDNVLDGLDAFPLDACASVDADNDDLPDSLVADCTTTLTDDADDDNNGLIEIRTLDELAFLRYDLNGNGTSADGMGNDMGCPDTGCIGYELMRSLDFSDAGSYADENNANMVAWTAGEGWTPIGSCTNANTCESYSGVFEGNNLTIANLFISFVDDDVFGVGLFGALSGSIRNLGLLNASVKVSNANGTSVGGLIGNGDDAEISHSYMTVGSVSGNDHVGGLVGSGEESKIVHSYVSGVAVSGDRNNVGGLVGLGNSVNVLYSYADIASVSGDKGIGGLVGSGNDAKISYSYAVNGNVFSTVPRFFSIQNNLVGGLIGGGSRIQINYSYAAVEEIRVRAVGDSIVGGLAGSEDDVVNASYWDNETADLTNVKGKGGAGGKTTTELQAPIEFAGSIYESWSNLVCDPNTGDVRTGDLSGRFTQYVWDLGTSEEYPALGCVVGGLGPQGRTTTTTP